MFSSKMIECRFLFSSHTNIIFMPLFWIRHCLFTRWEQPLPDIDIFFSRLRLTAPMPMAVYFSSIRFIFETQAAAWMPSRFTESCRPLLITAATPPREFSAYYSAFVDAWRYIYDDMILYIDIRHYLLTLITEYLIFFFSRAIHISPPPFISWLFHMTYIERKMMTLYAFRFRERLLAFFTEVTPFTYHFHAAILLPPHDDCTPVIIRLRWYNIISYIFSLRHETWMRLRRDNITDWCWLSLPL